MKVEFIECPEDIRKVAEYYIEKMKFRNVKRLIITTNLYKAVELHCKLEGLPPIYIPSCAYFASDGACYIYPSDQYGIYLRKEVASRDAHLILHELAHVYHHAELRLEVEPTTYCTCKKRRRKYTCI